MISTFEYTITGTGWAEIKLTGHNNDAVTITASYIGDPLPHIIDAICRLFKKESRLEVIEIIGENTSSALIFSELHPGLLRTEVIENAHFDVYDTIEARPLPPAFTSFDETYLVVYEIYRGLENLLKAVNPAKYKDKWGHDFPVEKFETLKMLIKEANKPRWA